MRSVASLLFLFLVISCSTKGKKEKKVYTMNGKVVPSWIYEVEKECPDGHLCSSGEGESLEIADQKAKVSLASVFESQVKSKFDIYNTSMSEGEIEEVKRSVQSAVNIIVDEVIRGVEIKEHFTLGKIHFAYASLSKLKATRLFMAEIKKIDDELEFLFEKKSRTSILRMLSLLDRRAVLADKMIIVGRKAPLQTITFSKVQNLKYSSGKSKDIFIKVSSQTPRTIEKYLTDLLNQVGYRITKELSKNNYIVEINYKVKEEYLNVKGFSKYSFSTVINAKNNNRRQIGSITKSFIESGRNEQDAYLKAKNKIQAYLKDNLEKLNLD